MLKLHSFQVVVSIHYSFAQGERGPPGEVGPGGARGPPVSNISHDLHIT